MKKYLVLNLFLLLLINISHLCATPTLHWPLEYSQQTQAIQKIPGVFESFEQELARALEHPNIKDRKITDVSVYGSDQNEVTNSSKGNIGITFKPGTNYRQIVNELISKSKPKPTHKTLSPAIFINFEDYKLGSGYFYGNDGYIGTCAHISEALETVTIKLINKKDLSFTEDTYEAKVIGRDDYSDLTLLKIKDKEISRFLEKHEHFPSVLIEHRDWAWALLKKGQKVTTIGFPFANPRKDSGTIVNPTANRWGPRIIVSELNIDPGYSGGILISEEGYMIGMNTQKQIISKGETETVYGFALDFFTAKYLLEQLKTYGKIYKDLLIRKEGNTFHISTPDRNFTYTVLWGVNEHSEHYITYNDIVYKNAYRVENGLAYPAGVKIWQIAERKTPPMMTIQPVQPRKSIIVNINLSSKPAEIFSLGDDAGFEGSAKMLSWFIRGRNTLEFNPEKKEK